MISRPILGLFFAGSLAIAACDDGGAKPNGPMQPETPSNQATTATVGGAEAARPPTSEPASTTGDAVYEGTISGVISDSMCGKDHSRMGDDGKDPIACTKKCVAAGAKYVLVDTRGEVYSLTDQRKPEAFAGRPVVVEGHIDPKAKSIHVHSLRAP